MFRLLAPLFAGLVTVILVAVFNGGILSPTIAFSGRAYLLLIGIGVSVSIWWCMRSDRPSERRVVRYAVIGALGSYVGCVVGYLLGCAMALGDLFQISAQTLTNVVVFAFLLPLHLIAVISASLAAVLVAHIFPSTASKEVNAQ
jgi:hypothetical protein